MSMRLSNLAIVNELLDEREILKDQIDKKYAIEINGFNIEGYLYNRFIDIIDQRVKDISQELNTLGVVDDV